MASPGGECGGGKQDGAICQFLCGMICFLVVLLFVVFCLFVVVILDGFSLRVDRTHLGFICCCLCCWRVFYYVHL